VIVSSTSISGDSCGLAAAAAPSGISHGRAARRCSRETPRTALRSERIAANPERAAQKRVPSIACTGLTSERRPPGAALPARRWIAARATRVEGVLGADRMCQNRMLNDRLRPDSAHRCTAPRNTAAFRRRAPRAAEHGTEAAFCGVFPTTRRTASTRAGFAGCPCSGPAPIRFGHGWPSFFKPFAPPHIKRVRDASYGMCVSRRFARAAAATWATYFRMVHHPPGSGTASTQCRWVSPRPLRRSGLLERVRRKGSRTGIESLPLQSSAGSWPETAIR